MPPRASADKRYLEKHGNLWRVVVNVPTRARAAVGSTKLKHPLNTDSLAEANRIKWEIVATLKARIAEAVNPGWDREKLLEKAQRLALSARSAGDDMDRYRTIDYELDQLLGDILGQPQGADSEGNPVYAREDQALAEEISGVANSTRTPFDMLHEKYLSTKNVKLRTHADALRSVKYLKAWCSKNEVGPYLQTLSRRDAIRFCDEIIDVAGDLHPGTLNKYIRQLSGYWKWLMDRDEVAANIWEGRTLKRPSVAADDKERPFTEEEMRSLLYGQTSPSMHDLMRIAALTGARLDPIVCLSVGDCANGTFRFKPQKKEPGHRLVPIHPALLEIVQRRCDGKPNDAMFFPEWPPVKKEGSQRERSFRASNQFTAYRRSVGVDETRDGVRRSLVNFHSFRRWFATEAERADQPGSIISAVVGHKRDGMTLGIYSSGPKLEQARRCVEAVQLPD